MRVLLAFFIIALTVGVGEAENLWVNNITVNEYDMTWSYRETYTGADSIAFRMNIDTGFGDNNSFVNAWEVLLADKELRKKFKTSIEKEQDIRINNETSGIYLVDVDATLSPDIIGKTHLYDTIVNRYVITYRFDNNILNSGSIWFMGQAKTPVTILMPQGVDVVNISGMDNVTINKTDPVEISGFFKEVSKDRGEITLNLSRNTSFIEKEINKSNASNASNESNVTSIEGKETKSLFETLSRIRNITIVVAGLVIISIIYIFKIRKK
jgi:hypothetical protein